MNPSAHAIAIVFAISAIAPRLQASTVNVATVDELKSAVAHARPGDHIIVADGKYAFTATLPISAAGTADAPLLIESATVGRAEITGDAGFRIAAPAAYAVLKGFVFTHKAGAMEIEPGAHHCRVTRNVFALKVTGRSTYLTVNGDENEIDHNTFRDKDTEGQMLFVQGAGTTMCKRNWVHHNLFIDFKNAHKNNASALHIGSSHRSMDSGFSVTEHNLFVRTVGENEGAICNKSCDNVYRYNTILDSTELSLRHGHRCQVYANFLINSEGLRFFAHDHHIYSNYFERCRPAISIGNGDNTIPPGPLTSHQRPDRVIVVFNTLVNNRSDVTMLPRRNGLGAEDLTFANNLIVGGGKAATIGGPLPRAKWEGNILWQADPGDLPANGFTAIDPQLTRDDRGVYRLSPHSAAIGKAVGSYPFVTEDLDAQLRTGKLDIGADQFSAFPATNHALTESEAGPNAPEQPNRPLISAPNTHWPSAPRQ